ncbi:hypothetical protein QR680_014431 [Steinernema hermaphroditum]|uniref:Uncharacterized protein n=1 Tax=Steinernema hermaphroditum TaxID=289476 RepID=A0AA39I8U7_9BILA|nr:hypothetical protein QR680_014431 [Steinernema hermaphroditum]
MNGGDCVAIGGSAPLSSSGVCQSSSSPGGDDKCLCCCCAASSSSESARCTRRSHKKPVKPLSDAAVADSVRKKREAAASSSISCCTFLCASKGPNRRRSCVLSPTTPEYGSATTPTWDPGTLPDKITHPAVSKMAEQQLLLAVDNSSSVTFRRESIYSKFTKHGILEIFRLDS